MPPGTTTGATCDLARVAVRLPQCMGAQMARLKLLWFALTCPVEAVRYWLALRRVHDELRQLEARIAQLEINALRDQLYLSQLELYVAPTSETRQ
jgi:hypothetical protein